MLENDHESNDLSFIGWPDIVTLEDADSMFRSFNSAFGCGEFGNEDDFRWLLFPYSEPTLKRKEEQDGPSKVINTNSSYSSNVSTTTESQMSKHNEQTKIYNQSEGNMEDQRLQNCGSYNDGGIGTHSFGYMQINTPFSNPGTKSLSNGATTLSSSHMEEFSTVCYGVAPIDSPLSNTNCEAKGARKRSQENLDSSVVPETSCLSTQLEATTLEASRLNKLQQVMNQLDIRTKLCLRDGLYRLARSAEHRHSSANANGRNEVTEESNELMDIETKTNPIDRSIAHLLFHRSSDPSANSACDGSSLKSHAMVDGFIDSLPFIVEK